VSKVLKYLVMLNLCLALASLAGSAWVARTVGTQAYWAGALATMIVGLAASLALLLSFLQSLKSDNASDSAVSGVLLAMLIRMGLPLAAMVMMQQTQNPLLGAGFMGLLVLNYLVALPIETLMSLQFVRGSKPKDSGQPSLERVQRQIKAHDQ